MIINMISFNDSFQVNIIFKKNINLLTIKRRNQTTRISTIIRIFNHLCIQRSLIFYLDTIIDFLLF